MRVDIAKFNKELITLYIGNRVQTQFFIIFIKQGKHYFSDFERMYHVLQMSQFSVGLSHYLKSYKHYMLLTCTFYIFEQNVSKRFLNEPAYILAILHVLRILKYIK